MPDVRDAVKYFHKRVLKVSEEGSTGLVTLAIEWTDPDIAAEWASLLVRRLNDRLRERALQEALIVDPAVPPKQRLRPKRAMTAIIGTLLGGLLGVFMVLAIHIGREEDASGTA
jgi:uncharacterized protein involved in exopolysaccharide biosynthesis